MFIIAYLLPIQNGNLFSQLSVVFAVVGVFHHIQRLISSLKGGDTKDVIRNTHAILSDKMEI